MNMYRIATFILALTFSFSCSYAQKAKPKVKAGSSTAKLKGKNDANITMFNDLVPSTAKIMIIDSIVVDYDGFIRHLPLPSESGTLSYYNDFFNTTGKEEKTVYENEFDNHAIFSHGDSINTEIYAVDKLGDKWGTPYMAKGIGNEYVQANYPFLCSDGITLYFGAKGEKSMGGYDIFMTRFNSDKNEFYEPENIGLPYNSTANDYLLAIDDFDQLGWLVTDRRQPKGKVCIYTFVPTQERQSYETDNLSTSKLTDKARIISIRDTWKNGNRDAAIKRLNAMENRKRTNNSNGENIAFVINDQTIFHSINDFRSPNAAKKFSQLQDMYRSLTRHQAELQQMREAFHESSIAGKQKMRQPILRAEKNVEKEEANVKNLEKEIRNAENLINKQ